jgi:hypothetical protein
MSLTRVFVSFDVAHDSSLYDLLLEESRKPGSGFEVSGGSQHLSGSENWREGVRRRIRAADQMIVICGEHTEASIGMSSELRIAQEEQTPYFLLWGHRDAMCTKPVGAKPSEGMYSWTRQILQDQIAIAFRRGRADAKVPSPS